MNNCTFTFQLIGICFEVHDTWKKRGELKKEEDKDKKAQLEMELRHEEIEPSPVDVCHYAFCYIGVLTGKFTLRVSCGNVGGWVYL